MHRFLLVATLAVSTGALACGGEQRRRSQAPPCTAKGRMLRLADLPEASGLVASRTPGRFWAQNDSGAPILFALDANGKTTGRVTLNAAVEDWEALAVGPCPGGSCIYVADIGDNGARRKHITIYRLPEPLAADGITTTIEIFQASYPDGAHNAEALLVSGDGRLYIVTKGDTGPIALYRFPSELKTGTPMGLERIGQPLSEKPAADARITDGAISSDGQRVVLRTHTALVFYPAASFLRGDFSEGRMFDISALREPQGEAVTLDGTGTVYVAGEGGGKGAPGTLAALSCPD